MTWREISCDQFNLLKRATLIDVRSPCEFFVESIPGAVNVPLFTDQERDFIGTVYAGQGELTARRRAMDIIAPKIPKLIDDIVAARRDNAPVVIHCWRGGLRSEAVASCLSIVGIDSWRLTGGYKAWRRVVLRDFEADQYKFRLVALQGHTGVGKTDILTALQEAGAKIINLEKLANHRGSVFGALGLGRQPSQKDFEARLWLTVRAFENYDGLVFTEAESKNIGRLSLPGFIYNRLKAAPMILVNGSLTARCDRILADYAGGSQAAKSKEFEGYDQSLPSVRRLPSAHSSASEHRLPVELYQPALTALAAIKDRLAGPIVRQVQELVANNQLRLAVELLLVHYYDHYYQKHIDKQLFVVTVSGDNPKQAAGAILQWTIS